MEEPLTVEIVLLSRERSVTVVSTVTMSVCLSMMKSLVRSNRKFASWMTRVVMDQQVFFCHERFLAFDQMKTILLRF